MLIIRVRKTKSKNHNFVNYKYNTEGCDLNMTDMNRFINFKFAYAKSMLPEDIAKIEKKWKHKLGVSNDEK